MAPFSQTENVTLVEIHCNVGSMNIEEDQIKVMHDVLDITNLMAFSEGNLFHYNLEFPIEEQGMKNIRCTGFVVNCDIFMFNSVCTQILRVHLPPTEENLTFAKHFKSPKWVTDRLRIHGYFEMAEKVWKSISNHILLNK